VHRSAIGNVEFHLPSLGIGSREDLMKWFAKTISAKGKTKSNKFRSCFFINKENSN